MKLQRMYLILLASTLLLNVAGCVSSTLETSQFRPVGAKNKPAESISGDVNSSNPVLLNPGEDTSSRTSTNPNGEDVFNEADRQEAISQMRLKGQQTSGEKTQIGSLPETAASQLTPEERAQKSAEMAQKAEAVNAEVSDSEVASKQASIKRLQQKAKSHYKSALQSIEN